VLLFIGDEVVPIPGYPLESVTDPTGAGDSFAGGFMGYLISKSKNHLVDDLGLIKESILMGSVMGTFAIEEFGIDGLMRITSEIYWIGMTNTKAVNMFSLFRKYYYQLLDNRL